MKSLICIIQFAWMFMMNILFIHANVKEENFSSSLMCDSVLSQVLERVPTYSKVIQEYKSSIYVRGNLKVHQSNHLLRLVPSMFRLDKDITDYIVENEGELHYTSPDIYDIKMRAYSGTFRRNRGRLGNVMELLCMNVYSSTLLPGKLVSPLNPKGSRYYNYQLDSVCIEGDSLRYHIRIIPRNKSIQLVSGYMVVDSGSWTIREIKLRGRDELLTFDVSMMMGRTGGEIFLPKHLNLDLMFNFMGNKIEADYSAVINYDSIQINNNESLLALSTSLRKYDLTDSYLLKCDKRQAIEDTAYIARIRPYPLAEKEVKLYADYWQRKKTVTEQNSPSKRRTMAFWGNVGDALFSHYTLDLAELGSVRCSPLVNPLMISYSHSNGFSYKQEFKYNLLFPNDRWLKATPRIGYNFTRKEFYWNVNADYFYWPERLGAFWFRIGNGNRIHTSRVIDEIKQLPDSLLDFDKLNLDYFRDSYLKFGHQIELFNGMDLMTGISIHRRSVIDKPEISVQDIQKRNGAASFPELKSAYVSFAPHIKLMWTPGQYYYMNGRRKIKLHSHFPTISLDYERGIKGVLGSSGSYERTELDIQQSIPLSLMTTLSYRLGSGIFTDQNDVYFVDFVNFSRSNLPIGWKDEIGGTFQLLDSRWYNSSQYYIRGHLTYDAPFLLLPHLKKYTRLIDSERIYMGVLFEERLKPYIEMGYGVGTHIFDFGIFVNNVNGNFREFGCKFTFELFSK